jgi:hypothetical protein
LIRTICASLARIALSKYVARIACSRALCSADRNRRASVSTSFTHESSKKSKKALLF